MAEVIFNKLEKVYSNGFKAVHGIDLKIADGEFMVIVGPSGCAKSTTLRMLAGLETISGGCDCDTHQRRMRTKLISMAMRGFERVIVEPSGIFDVDEFFDVLRDEPLDRWYQLGNVIAIVDALLPEELSPQAEYILASESAWAGSVLLSRCQLASDAQKQGAEAHLARALEACKCSRKFGPEEIIAKDWACLLYTS